MSLSEDKVLINYKLKNNNQHVDTTKEIITCWHREKNNWHLFY